MLDNAKLKTHASQLNEFYMNQTKENALEKQGITSNDNFPSFSRLSSQDHTALQDKASSTSREIVKHAQFKDTSEIKRKSEQLLAKSGV